MGGGNPMNVDKFSYKGEFQDRGAAHVHGTLWVKMHVIEKLKRLKDGSFITKTKYNREKRKEAFDEPFKGITEAFRKFKNEKFTDDDDDKPVIAFIDQFTTVSLCADEVGKEVVEIAKEVNKHHHTKTCKKKSPNCRFRYPKFPIWKTILVRPYKYTEFAEEREKTLQHYADVLKKVKELLEDDEIIESITMQFDKKNETKEEYVENRKKKILELLSLANVEEKTYLNALKYSRAGYSYHQKRDLGST